MADSDVTSLVPRLNGFYQPNTLVKSTVHILDLAVATSAKSADTHDLVKIPAGHAVVGVTIVSLTSFASSGAATMTIKVKAGTETAAAIGSAVSLTNLAVGKVTKLVPAGALSLKATNGVYAGSVLQMTVGTAAYTAGKAMIIVDTIPVADFLVNG